MDQDSGESGLELVLDHRKLIIAFVLLMVVCAAFFLFGFIEGKRQALKAGTEPIPTGPATSSLASNETKAPAGDSGKTIEDRSLHEQLEWYKNVSKRAELDANPRETIGAPKPPEAAAKDVGKSPDGAAGKEGTTPVSSTPSGASPRVVSAKVTYSVQVGAFRDLKEAEKKSAALKVRGYRYSIHPPTPGNDYYTLKVGIFDSRANAVAMQLKLKKDGFSTLIKTN